MRLVWVGVIASVASCSTSVTDSAGRRWRVVNVGSPDSEAENWRDKTCPGAEAAAKRQAEVPDPWSTLACGPFPCDYGGKCLVSKCDEKNTCSTGFCSKGYCVRAVAQGPRFCQPASPESVYDNPPSAAGCRCTPLSSRAMRDEATCGQFPCSPEGCYVRRCKIDADCAYGMCSSHASGPHGYCVTDDPI